MVSRRLAQRRRSGTERSRAHCGCGIAFRRNRHIASEQRRPSVHAQGGLRPRHGDPGPGICFQTASMNPLRTTKHGGAQGRKPPQSGRFAKAGGRIRTRRPTAYKTPAVSVRMPEISLHAAAFHHVMPGPKCRRIRPESRRVSSPFCHRASRDAGEPSRGCAERAAGSDVRRAEQRRDLGADRPRPAVREKCPAKPKMGIRFPSPALPEPSAAVAERGGQPGASEALRPERSVAVGEPPGRCRGTGSLRYGVSISQPVSP